MLINGKDYNIAPYANLRGADLRGAYLYEANLYEADLRGAYLYEADLSGADLRGANLYGAHLSRTNLSGANLYGAHLRGADLRGTNLSGAYLRGAYLRGADLRGADLRGANLYEADLSGCRPRGATLPEGFEQSVEFKRTRILPDEGDVIGWKKLSNGLAKLLIPASAKRCHAFGRKCRASEAKVLELIGFDGSPIVHGVSSHDSSFGYRVGEIVKPSNGWGEDWKVECAPGIHFFITRSEAANY